MVIEHQLANYFNQAGFWFSAMEDKVNILDLEARKRIILLDLENVARHKSHSLWLTCGDDNTSFFHKFANFRITVNSIWKIVDDHGITVEGFGNIVVVGVNNFGTLFY